MGWSRPSLFTFPSHLTFFQVFPPFMRPHGLSPFPFPVSPMCVPCVVHCSSCRFWGATLSHCPRHWQDMQVRSTLRHLHHAVLHVNVGPHLQHTMTSRQTDYAVAMV